MSGWQRFICPVCYQYTLHFYLSLLLILPHIIGIPTLSPWLDAVFAKPNILDHHYAPMRLERVLERVDIPVLIITGWYDLFLEQSKKQYTRLRDRGCNFALTVGP